ncbi:MAG: YbaB/EbfC family nucleoid-associated protein [Planctomycetota bacterium]|jgi:DNA-binding YbaB/EbfC family protein
MFKELGQLAGLMKNVGKIKEEMANLQTRLGQIQAEGEAGGDMVKVKVNGSMEVLSIRLSDEAAKMSDREMVEDLLVSACNQALKKVRLMVNEETQKMATGLGLPAGMGLPGLGG